MTSTSQLSIEAFPAWARLNDVDFYDVRLQETEKTGFGLVATKHLGRESGDGLDGESPSAPEVKDAGDASMKASGGSGPGPGQGLDSQSPLLRIPHDLILSTTTVEEYAKVDQNFRQLLDVAGHQSTRGDVMLYLLTHLKLPSRDPAVSKRGASTPWTEYLKFLPRQIPVPTMWTELERALLRGTSLEAALDAKLTTLTAEFDELHEKTSEMPFWSSLFWEKDNATIDDWVLADAWYRSRSLELPRDGDAMVPGLDMVNHSAKPTAYYEQDDRDDIVLLLRPSPGVACGGEITISYGEAKPAAEMLFSYGFVDPDSTSHELVLPLQCLPEDPLAPAKLHISKSTPSVKLFRADGKSEWVSPFAYLMCLNEEDGLRFRVLQDTDGEQQLKLFWQEEDVTARWDEFETLIQGHPLCPVFKLRVVAVLHDLVSTQLGRLEHSEFSHEELEQAREAGLAREECILAAEALRAVETDLMRSVAKTLEAEKLHLLADEHVVAYLGPTEATESGQAPSSPANDAEEFS